MAGLGTSADAGRGRGRVGPSGSAHSSEKHEGECAGLAMELHYRPGAEGAGGQGAGGSKRQRAQ